MDTIVRYEKWVIIPLSEVLPFSVVGIDYKIPSNVKECTGVAFTITDVHEGGFNTMAFMGEVSLQLNNAQVHPIHFQTEFRTSNFRMEQILHKLEVPLIAGSRVKGYYKSYLDLTQSMNIYLQCIAEEL